MISISNFVLKWCSFFESYEVSRGSEVEVEGAKCLGELGETDSGVSNVEAIRSEIDEKSAQPPRIDVKDCDLRRVDTAQELSGSSASTIDEVDSRSCLS